MKFGFGVLLIGLALLAEIPSADAKPFALKVRSPSVRMGSYELAYTYLPSAASGLQVGVRLKLHRKNALLQESEVLSAGSIEEMLIKPGLTVAERSELKAYLGLDEKALQSLQSELARNSDVTLSELERKAEEILLELPIPVYRPEPVQRKPSSDDSQVLDFSVQ